MKKRAKDWLLFFVFLLDDIAVVVLVLLGLRFLGVEMSFPIGLVLVATLGGFVFLAHKTIIPAFHLKTTTGSEGMVGMCGEVIEPLAPVGLIKIAGECWNARSVDERIDAGEHVEVLRVERLMLHVKRKEPHAEGRP
ncbi:MAG: NfeD family protein [Dehalococcoidia bacterium]|nr:NfeD family protein [Dehalococcoidia bacterium]